MADEIRFTDEELAFLRFARFGELPGRVPPEERVEFIEAQPERNVHPSPDPPPAPVAG